jgi:DNA helicase-2/ATP-dependent DNA helicase PcrA
MQPIMLFKEHPEILAKYQERFSYVLIDEYQDTNYAQYMLTKMISAKYKNICVVGDENQAIYSFRGSNYRNILNFEKDYKEAEVIMLEENYRSTKNILNAANSVIKNNKQRKDKNLWTSNLDGLKIKYHRAIDEKDEAEYVVKEIEKLIDKGTSKSEIATLYRTNAQSRNIEDVLLRKNIGYKVVGSFYFYARREIKDLISYLKVIYNQNDDVNLLRIINVPKRGIGDMTIKNLTKKASDNQMSLYDSISDGKELIFKNLIDELIDLREKSSLTELIELILVKSGIKKELMSEKTIEADIRLENLEEFKTITKSYEERSGIVSLEDFLQEISLVSDMSEHKNEKDVVTLMTIHSAKGLEFENVFVTGLEEGVFPHNNSMLDAEELEEERRLCYVAITRAKERLWLVNARRRMLFGIDNYNPVSRFVEEIDSEYLEQDEEQQSNIINLFRKPTKIDTDVVYNIGDTVIHNIYKEGLVVGVDSSVVTIAFPHPYGIKKIIKGHPSITKV